MPDTDHPTQYLTLTQTRTLWVDLCLDAVACKGSINRLIRPKGDAVDWGCVFQNSRTRVHPCCIAHKTKNAVRTITSNITETGIWSKSAPQIPLGGSTPLRSFTGGVLPTDASKGHTTPGRTQSSHNIVPIQVGLALVLLELEKSGAPLPCNCILAPPLCKLQHSRSQIRQSSRQQSRR